MKNKILKLSMMAFALLLVSGFAILALSDINVKSSQITKIIPNERFFKDR